MKFFTEMKILYVTVMNSMIKVGYLHQRNNGDRSFVYLIWELKMNIRNFITLIKSERSENLKEWMTGVFTVFASGIMVLAILIATLLLFQERREREQNTVYLVSEFVYIAKLWQATLGEIDRISTGPDDLRDYLTSKMREIFRPHTHPLLDEDGLLTSSGVINGYYNEAIIPRKLNDQMIAVGFKNTPKNICLAVLGDRQYDVIREAIGANKAEADGAVIPELANGSANTDSLLVVSPWTDNDIDSFCSDNRNTFTMYWELDLPTTYRRD